MDCTKSCTSDVVSLALCYVEKTDDRSDCGWLTFRTLPLSNCQISNPHSSAFDSSQYHREDLRPTWSVAKMMICRGTRFCRGANNGKTTARNPSSARTLSSSPRNEQSGGSIMKPVARLAGALLLAFVASTLTARAQVPYNQGTVTRVVLLNILPGHSDALFADLKKNVVPLWEAEKSAGLILDY